MYHNSLCFSPRHSGLEHGRTKKKGQIWDIFLVNLGVMEGKTFNIPRLLGHYMIAASFGHDESLKIIRDYYSSGFATKVQYEKALRAHQKYADEVTNDQRDEAAVFRNECLGQSSLEEM